MVGCGEPQPPVAVGSIPELTVEVDSTESVDLAGYFSDPDEDELSYAASSSDEGVATASASGSSLTVAGVSKGTATVTVTATDPGGLPAEQSVTVTVPNRVPEASDTIPDAEVYIGETGELTLSDHFSDPDGDELSYAASSSNDEVATVAISGDTVAVTGVAVGSAEIAVTASDGSSEASQDFTAFVFHVDRRVLEILYDELNGDGWADNTNWKTVKPLDEWYGVSTSADGRVEVLGLYDNSLTGEIPPELGELANLKVLNLRENQLTGEIPPELGKLEAIDTLTLRNNALTGPIPPELGELANVRWLSLYINLLSGPIPPELLGLEQVEFLALGFNRLTGSIPAGLGSMRSLSRLWLNHNRLTGEVPPDLGDLGDGLEWLDFQGNTLLSGRLPRELTKLTGLLRFEWGTTNLCSPPDREFQDWVNSVETQHGRGPVCDS